jgi:FMN phosphatase YigB (HAD superfamily)
MDTPVRHLWFDFSDTIALINREAYNALVYRFYADAVGREVTPELVAEYKKLLEKHTSNSGIFFSLGLPTGYLSDRINSVPPESIYALADKNIPDVLKRLKNILPISIFSNSNLSVLLPALGIDPSLFTHRLGPDSVKAPKPALDGFYKMAELSGVPASEAMFIGDDVEKDLVPAKTVGMRTGLVWSVSGRADYCFKNFEEILAFFE